ncbi:hypothetical protein [Paraburkholderia silvatlantica]|uniref:Transmembrane protein n=1 Tax=Paraburkholderia silvatlantica TaxID=321895 RepID=A0ABR6FPZ6_9BURK|nr:hypothetical protein [Paraburkholderia silvatlantica]MBB2929500.1 hypothetical protein [Paraburkholderia silvatlantica]PVY35809.1 hypothetical protein C7411_104142 [Paraburkholderia silvatlantica]PXW39757.1 hypothetical protein C7413_10593 [Paraburkholderia silvatlantica]
MMRRASCALLLASLLGSPLAAFAQAPRYAFAVVANALSSQSEEPSAQRLIDAIGRDPQIAFTVYDGNIKGARETCADHLYERRHDLLDASRAPLVFVPGERDWISCGMNGSGAYDPAERLDFLRQNFFSDPNALGQTPLTLTRESEVSRFRPYRENVRWQLGDTVFIGLNVPDGNNHYLNAGGRNGEFEDRVIANGFWLEHAAEYAKRRNARAIVIFMQGNAMPEHYERPDRFAWLRFHRAPRDGYLELRRSLVKLAEIFRGQIIVVNADDSKLAHGFTIDQPLRNDKGAKIENVTRIAFSLRDPLTQWLQVDADMARRTPLRVSVRDVPKHLPLLPAQPSPNTPGAGSSPAMPEMPEVSSMPDVTEIPGMPQSPDVAPATPGASGTAVPSGLPPAGNGVLVPAWPTQGGQNGLNGRNDANGQNGLDGSNGNGGGNGNGNGGNGQPPDPLQPPGAPASGGFAH